METCSLLPIPDRDAENLPLFFMTMKQVSEQLVTNKSLPSSQSATKVKVDDVALHHKPFKAFCWPGAVVSSHILISRLRIRSTHSEVESAYHSAELKWIHVIQRSHGACHGFELQGSHCHNFSSRLRLLLHRWATHRRSWAQLTNEKTLDSRITLHCYNVRQ